MAPAPTSLLHKLKAYYTGEDEVKDVPEISHGLAIALLLLYTFLYVVPFYLSSSTRPSPQLSRDAPSVIRARITSVSWSCALCSISTFVLLASMDKGTPLVALHSMGYFPPGILAAIRTLLLTAILFLGPLFEAGIVEGGWRDWLRFKGASSLLGSWIGYRNLVAGPLTEEILFRSCSVPLFVLAHASIKTILFGTPIIFGLAHIHHFYEFRITHPHVPITSAFARSLFQLAYTTLFGAYATFLYLRTGSLLSVILAHAFCNWMGLPRVWGRLEGNPETLIGPDSGESSKRSDDQVGLKSSKESVKTLSLGWTIAYYILLVAGALGWWQSLWTLTESPDALVDLKHF